MGLLSVVKTFGSPIGIYRQPEILILQDRTAQKRVVLPPAQLVDVLSDICLGEPSVYNCLSLELNSFLYVKTIYVFASL